MNISDKEIDEILKGMKKGRRTARFIDTDNSPWPVGASSTQANQNQVKGYIYTPESLGKWIGPSVGNSLVNIPLALTNIEALQNILVDILADMAIYSPDTAAVVPDGAEERAKVAIGWSHTENTYNTDGAGDLALTDILATPAASRGHQIGYIQVSGIPDGGGFITITDGADSMTWFAHTAMTAPFYINSYWGKTFGAAQAVQITAGALLANQAPGISVSVQSRLVVV